MAGWQRWEALTRKGLLQAPRIRYQLAIKPKDHRQMAKPAQGSTATTEWDRDAALTTARILLEIKAVNFRPEEPYTFTSGWKSPVYIDCRRII